MVHNMTVDIFLTVEVMNVIFFIDTGFPVSYLSEKAMKALIENPGCHYPSSVHSNKVIECHLSSQDKHFADVNVLGMDFIFENKLSIVTV